MRKRLLLHSCCGPCSTIVISILKENYDVDVFFYNPNIYPFDEYEKRYNEEVKVCKNLEVNLIKAEYDDEDYYKFVSGHEGDKEGGDRCRMCFEYRLNKSAIYAKEHGYDVFATTLSVSPHKNTLIINEVGNSISQIYDIEFLADNFKKKDGYKKSIILSNQMGLYRQNYCGCKYSLRSING